MMKSILCTLLMCLTMNLMAQDFIENNPIDAFGSVLGAGDFDGDGDTDAICIAYDFDITKPSDIYLYRNTSTSDAINFEQELILSDNIVGNVAVGDVDQDGDLDVVFSKEFQTYNAVLWQNDGAANFTEIDLGFSGVRFMELVDTNGDGYLDIVGNGNSTFFRYLYDPASNAFVGQDNISLDDSVERFAVGDLGNDGDMDVVIGFRNFFGEQARVVDFSNDTQTNFSIAENSYIDIQAVGIDYVEPSEPNADVLVLSGDGLYAFINNATDEYEPVLLIPSASGEDFKGFTSADYNGDGLLDFIISNNNDGLYLYQNTSVGDTYTFESSKIGIPIFSRYFHNEDLNGDGKLDVLVTNSEFWWYENQLEMVEPPFTVFDAIAESPDHTTLETAILAAGLDDELEGEAPLTVFAPTDAAFSELPAGALDALLDDPMGALAQTLLYHVVNGNVLSTDLMDGQSVVTLNGESVTIAINNNTISINDSEVTVADIETDNGVVHVVSTVIQPPNSIKDIATIQLNAYPNPVTDLLTIELPNEMLGQAVTALLIDNLGKTIKSFSLTENINAVSVSNIPTGIYHLSIEANNIRAYQMVTIH